MGLLEELAAFKEIIAERGLEGSVSKTTFGFVYNQPFYTENIGEEFEDALENLRKLDIPK